MTKRVALVSVLLLCLSLCAAAGPVLLFGVTGVSGGASSLYTVNTTTGAPTLVGATGYSGISSLGFAPDGTTLYAIANASGHVLITINTSTGAGTTVGATGLSVNVPDIAVRADGVIFGADGNGVMHTFNASTGAATTLGSLGIGFIGGGALAFDSGGTLYLASILAGHTASDLYTVNQSTGAATLVGTFDFSALPMGTDRLAGMKFQPGTGTLFATAFVNIDPANTTRIVTASTFSGTIPLTSIGDPGVVFEAVAFGSQGTAPPPPTGIPVPSTLLLLGTGLLAVMIWIYWSRGAGATV